MHEKRQVALIGELSTAEYIHYQILALVNNTCILPPSSHSKTWILKSVRFGIQIFCEQQGIWAMCKHVQLQTIREKQGSTFSQRRATYKMMQCWQERMCCLQIAWDRIGQQWHMWWSNAHLQTFLIDPFKILGPVSTAVYNIFLNWHSSLNTNSCSHMTWNQHQTRLWSWLNCTHCIFDWTLILNIMQKLWW